MRSALRSSRALGAAAFAGSFLFVGSAAADVILIEKDGWTFYTRGRAQTFLSYNNGEGFPKEVVDGNGAVIELQGGGIDPTNAYIELPTNPAPNDPGKVEELRIRTGFVGNVLGFGIKKQLSEDTEVLGYTAVTTIIESPDRRKYLGVIPDWRESYAKITGPWGSVLAGRSLTLFSRGATEITYLYAYKYGLGFPGSVTFNGPTAGHVGFGVLGNGFGAGLVYATPVMAGLQITAGIYDANNIPGAGWERVKWPRPESEITYEMKLGNTGMFKLFANGALQKLYRINAPQDTTAMGVGYGGRLEVGPVKLGLAGHYGVGTGMNFAFDPSQSIADPNDTIHELRKFDGYYAQLMVSPTSKFDISAGAGVSRAKQLPQDKVDDEDNDMNPATGAGDDDGIPGPDSVGHTVIKQQLGFSGGVSYHVSDNLHLNLDYFRAMFKWFTPAPTGPGLSAPEQKFHFLSAGITYDW